MDNESPISLTLVRMVEMLNGAGILHGGCIAYLIDMYVPPANQSLGDDRNLDLRFNSAVAALPSSYLVTFRERTGLG